tara:strand:- start:887 stop:1210 length:324 start_codon:yes stop_codon:yes gene_type:complete
MNNKSVTIAGLLLIASTILFDFIFIMNSGFTFNLTSAFLLGALNMMALHFIRVIFKFKVQKESEVIVLIPTILIVIKEDKVGIAFLNRILEIKLKYKELSKPTITKA